MGKNAARLTTTLFFLSSLFVTSGQNSLIATQDRSLPAPKGQVAPAVLVAEIGPYGNLVGLNDGGGKNLLKKIPRPWHEGYAIAYRVKDKNGVDEDRFFYVLGDRAFPTKPKVEYQKSTSSTKIITTEDRVLEIARFITWDEKSRSLKSQITITNISNHDLRLRAFEMEIDKRVASLLVARRNSEFLSVFDTPQPECPMSASMGCFVGDDCPSCPCGPLCDPKPGQAKAFVREPVNRDPVINEDIIGKWMPPVKVPMLCLSWAGSNLSTSTMKPGKQIVANYSVNISLQKLSVQ